MKQKWQIYLGVGLLVVGVVSTYGLSAMQLVMPKDHVGTQGMSALQGSTILAYEDGVEVNGTIIIGEEDVPL